MRKYVVELIGTFFLVLTVVMAVNMAGPNNFLAPVAIGSALMVMIFAGGHISGAHYNPAVTLAVWIRGKCDTSDVLPYIVAQVVGAALATLVAAPMLGFKGINIAEGVPAFGNPLGPILAEFFGTFALAYVVLNTATAKGTSGNSFYGLAIGFTVTAMAYALGGVSGGAFNPAVGVGITMAGMSAMSNLLVYVLACLAGGAAAAFVFKFVNDPTDR